MDGCGLVWLGLAWWGPSRTGGRPSLLTCMERLPGLCCILGSECGLARALHRRLERLGTGSANDQRAPTAPDSGGVAPRVHIWLHLHLLEDDVGPVGPVLARGGVRHALGHAHYIIRDRVQHPRPDGRCVARPEACGTEAGERGGCVDLLEVFFVKCCCCCCCWAAQVTARPVVLVLVLVLVR